MLPFITGDSQTFTRQNIEPVARKTRGYRNLRVGPKLRVADREILRAGPIQPSRNDGDHRRSLEIAAESRYVFRATPIDRQGDEFSFRKQCTIVAAKSQSLPDQIKLDTGVTPIADELAQEFRRGASAVRF